MKSKHPPGDGEIARWLIVYAVLPDGLHSVPTIHSSSTPEELDAPFMGTRHTHGAHTIYIQATHTHIKSNTHFLKRQSSGGSVHRGWKENAFGWHGGPFTLSLVAWSVF